MYLDGTRARTCPNHRSRNGVRRSVATRGSQGQNVQTTNPTNKKEVSEDSPETDSEDSTEMPGLEAQLSL